MALRRLKPPVERVRGGYALRISEDERELVTRLLGELRDLILRGSDDPALRRMFPPAYHDAADAEAQVEYQRLMGDDLVASRLASINTVSELLAASAKSSSLAPPILTEAQTFALMQSTNALRLVLGTILDVGESDEPQVDEEHPMAQEQHLYGYLSWLLDWTVQALSQS